MKLYVVATDDYEEYYGAEINLHGVFSEEELAKDYLKNKYLERGFIRGRINLKP